MDQSTSVCGWARFEDCNLIEYGLWILKEFEEKKNVTIRNRIKVMQNDNRFSYVWAKNNGLAFLRCKVDVIAKYCNINNIVWENLKSNTNADVIRKLGEPTGVLKEYCQTNSIDYYEYIPSSLRAKLWVDRDHKGSATKFDLAKIVSKEYGIELPKKRNGELVTDKTHEFFNVSDAIGIGMYHYKYGLKMLKENKRG